MFEKMLSYKLINVHDGIQYNIRLCVIQRHYKTFKISFIYASTYWTT